MNSNESSSAKNSLRNGIILAIFALVTTGLTALTWVLTKDRIESEKERALLRAISEIVPANLYTNDPYRDCVLLTDELLLGSNQPQQAWRLRNLKGNTGGSKEDVAVLISSIAPNGYNGAINIIVGHYLNKSTLNKPAINKTSLAGVRVTHHKETPGLGDKIETRKSNWIFQFADLNTTNIAQNYWQVKKDGGKFDAFTGATITPRALLSAVSKNINYFHQHKDEIFAAPPNCFLTDSDPEPDQATREAADE